MTETNTTEPDLGAFHWVRLKDTDRAPEIMRQSACSDGSRVWLQCGNDYWSLDAVDVLSGPLEAPHVG